MLESKRTVCILCSLACPFEVVGEDGAPRSLEYVLDDPLTGGALCAKGNMAFELLRLPGRINEPEVDGRATRWPETLSRLAEDLDRLPPGSTGLVLGPDASAEEARLAGLFAERCLGGAPAAVAFSAGESEVLAEAEAAPPVPDLDLAAIGDYTVVLAVGDLFALAPVISRKVLDAKYGGRGHALVSLGAADGLTARLASLRVSGGERRAALAVLAELAATAESPDVKKVAELVSGREPGVAGAAEAARVLAAGGRVAVLTATADPVAVRLGRLIAAALGEKAAFGALTEAAAARDILGSWRPPSGIIDLAEAVKKDKLKGLLILGADLVGSGAVSAEDLARLSVVAASSAFPSATTAAAGYVLPGALWMEKAGKLAGADRKPAAPPSGAGQSYGWVLTGLARELGVGLEGAPSSAAAEPMALAEVVELAAGDEEGPAAPWTARESSDPLLRAVLDGVYVA